MVRFHEVQRFRQWWVWLAVAAGALPSWVLFAQQVILSRPVGDDPAPDWLLWVIVSGFGIALPAFFLALRLVVEVDDDALVFGFAPLHRRRIRLDQVEAAEPCDYSPIRHYGGWGARWHPRRGRAYNVSGNRGVRIQLTDGRQVLLGTERAEELAAAIASGSSRLHRR